MIVSIYLLTISDVKKYFSQSWTLICIKDNSFYLKQQQAFSIKSTFIWKVKKEFALCQGTKYLKKINEAKNNRNNDKNIMLLPWQSEKTCIRTLLLSKILTKTYDMTTIAFQKSSYYHLIPNYVINENTI